MIVLLLKIVHYGENMADKKIIDFAAKKAEGITNNSGSSEAKMTNKAVSVGLNHSEPKVNVIRDGKVVEIDPSKVDPQTTVNVKNPELDELIDKFTEEKSNENLNILLNKLESARVLLPGKLLENKLPVPLTISTTEGEIVQPVFTDKSKMEKAPKCEVILNLPFAGVLATVIEKGKDVAGVAINPFGNAVILKRDLLEKMAAVLKQRVAAQKAVQAIPGGVKAETVKNEDGTLSTKMKLTQEQYTLFERSRFEVASLSKKFFENGQSFIDEISTRKEEYIDELFEESFTEKRMYPYLVDEFKVVAMSISETLDIVTITMPTRDIVAGIAESIYIAWNKESKKGRYFLIVKGKEKDTRDAIEISAEGGKPVALGTAPTEGTELNWVLGKLE